MERRSSGKHRRPARKHPESASASLAVHAVPAGFTSGCVNSFSLIGINCFAVDISNPVFVACRQPRIVTVAIQHLNRRYSWGWGRDDVARR